MNVFTSHDSPPLLRSRAGAMLCALWAVIGLLYLLTPPNHWQLEGGDELEYIGLAHALQSGAGYALDGRPHLLYPPAYPFFLSLFWSSEAPPFSLLYAANALLGLAGVGMVSAWAWRRAGPGAGVVVLTSYYFWSFSCRFLMAEPLFFLGAWSALIVSERLGAPCKDTTTSTRMRMCFVALIGLGVLVAAAAKSAAIALTAALCVSGAITALRSRFRRGVALVLVAACCGGGFWAAWEIRASRHQEGVRESYAQWAARFLGIGQPAQDLVAHNRGEGLKAGQNTWPHRATHLTLKSGQSILSMVRTPPAANGLVIGAVLLAAGGLLMRLIRNPACPIAWYTLISWLMFSMTSWASSYLRYVYAILPACIVFAVQAGSRLTTTRNPLARGGVALWALATMLWAALHFNQSSPLSGSEKLYGLAWTLAGLGIAALALFRAAFHVRIPTWIPKAALVLFCVHNLALITQQKRLALLNDTATRRGILDAQVVADWTRAHTPLDSVGAVSLPRFTRILTSRTCFFPEGSVDVIPEADWILLTGPLREVPAFIPFREQKVRIIATNGPWQLAYQHGQAALYLRQKNLDALPNAD